MTPFKILKNLNYAKLNLFEYDSNVLPNRENFSFVSYRINLHISSCLTKKEKWQNHAHRYILWLIYAFEHLGDFLTYQVPIANTDIYKCSFPQDQ